MTRFILNGNTFYHGIYGEFDRFYPLSHFGTLRAAKAVVGYGPKKEMGQDDKNAKIVPVKLKLTNTYELQDIETLHDYMYYKTVLLYHFAHDLKLKQVPKIYDYITVEPFKKASLSSVIKELKQDTLFDQEAGFVSESSDRTRLFLQRMIHYFESIGFDGFHYTNNHEDEGSVSYIPFRPENIIRLDINLPTEKYNIGTPKKFDDLGFRNYTKDEKLMLNIEGIFWMKTSVYKLFLLNTHKKALLRSSAVKQLKESKIYYSNLFFKEVLPKIKQVSYQAEYGYHGLSHTSQVAMFGLDIALSVNQDPLPVLLAAGLHDCARTNDDYCEMHGPNCEPIARKFLSENYSYLLPHIKERIIEAVKKHTTGMRTEDLISACLWDADRIRLSWEMGYEPRFFSTPYAKNIASLTKPQQDKYIKKQEDFLVAHNIKTRRQIEYEKIMDACCNAYGTVFKVR